MSYDIVVQRLVDGDRLSIPAGLFEDVFLPFVDRREPEFHFRHLHTPDGGEADLYADLNREPFTGFIVNHFSAGLVLDLIVEFARRADAVVVLPGCPTALTNPGQREHLPPVLADSAALVHDGAGILALLATI